MSMASYTNWEYNQRYETMLQRAREEATRREMDAIKRQLTRLGEERRAMVFPAIPAVPDDLKKTAPDGGVSLRDVWKD